jgi:alkyl sulfatase BDS1-like metallo-beta-lactamase superfamily hydrolase
MDQKPPTTFTESIHRDLVKTLPFDDTTDFTDADRGYLASWPGAVRAADGRSVWDTDSYAFLTGEAPTSVNRSLWRQSTLVAKQTRSRRTSTPEPRCRAVPRTCTAPRWPASGVR